MAQLGALASFSGLLPTPGLAPLAASSSACSRSDSWDLLPADPCLAGRSLPSSFAATSRCNRHRRSFLWGASCADGHLGFRERERFVRAGTNSQETVNLSLDEEVGENVVPAPPPTTGRIDIVVDKDAIRKLDLSAAHAVLRKFVHRIGDNVTPPAADPKELLERTVGFVLKYEADDPLDPRELSEMPDIRLWFVRLDAAYPWLPVVLDWRAGELARYAAMLVPHQMSKRSGLVFNPEALELFAMSKVFLLHPWLIERGIAKPSSKLNDMLRMLGFSVTNQLYDLIEQNSPP